MRAKSSALLLLVACMVLGGSCAQAVVTVAPEAMQGWSIATSARGWGALCPWGPSVSESGTVAFPSGRGAFYATCDYFKGQAPYLQNDWNPSTVWLGLDQWNGSSVAGRTLGSITQMNYWSFTSEVPQRWAGAGGGGEVEYWTKNGWWGFPQQPILLELTAESPDGTERRQFWYRPDGGNYVGDDGHRLKGEWYQWNCLTWGKWYTPRSADITADPDAEEFGCTSWNELTNASLGLKFPSDPAGDTPARTALFGTWKLVATSNDPYPTGWKSTGWHDGTWMWDLENLTDKWYPHPLQLYPATDPIGHPNCTGTGKAINFHVGARMGKTYPLWLQGVELAWVNNTYGFRGQVDLFTLGFNGTSVAYDFEPSATEKSAMVVGANTKSLGAQTVEQYLNLAPIIQGAYLFNPVVGGPDTHTGSTEIAQKKFLFKVSGKVTRSNTGTWDNSKRQWQNGYFVVEDGSGLVYTDTGVTPAQVLPAPLWVYLAPRADGLSVYNGDYVSAYGFVEPMRWKNVGTPLIMWSAPAHVVNYTFP